MEENRESRIPLVELRGGIFLAKHEDLAKFRADADATFHMEVIKHKKNHCVVTCCAEWRGASVIEVGEATEKTAPGGLKEYTFTLAWNRALDKATLRLLRLPVTVKADVELNGSYAMAEAGKPEQAVYTAEHGETGHAAEPVSRQPQPSARETQEETEIIEFGKFKGMTVQEARKDPSYNEYRKWLVDKKVSFDDEKKQGVLMKMLA